MNRLEKLREEAEAQKTVEDQAFSLLLGELKGSPSVRDALTRWHQLHQNSCVAQSEGMVCCVSEVIEELLVREIFLTPH